VEVKVIREEHDRIPIPLKALDLIDQMINFPIIRVSHPEIKQGPVVMNRVLVEERIMDKTRIKINMVVQTLIKHHQILPKTMTNHDEKGKDPVSGIIPRTLMLQQLLKVV
jgi:hypothetical protein